MTKEGNEQENKTISLGVHKPATWIKQQITEEEEGRKQGKRNKICIYSSNFMKHETLHQQQQQQQQSTKQQQQQQRQQQQQQ